MHLFISSNRPARRHPGVRPTDGEITWSPLRGEQPLARGGRRGSGAGKIPFALDLHAGGFWILVTEGDRIPGGRSARVPDHGWEEL